VKGTEGSGWIDIQKLTKTTDQRKKNCAWLSQFWIRKETDEFRGWTWGITRVYFPFSCLLEIV